MPFLLAVISSDEIAGVRLAVGDDCLAAWAGDSGGEAVENGQPAGDILGVAGQLPVARLGEWTAIPWSVEGLKGGVQGLAEGYLETPSRQGRGHPPLTLVEFGEQSDHPKSIVGRHGLTPASRIAGHARKDGQAVAILDSNGRLAGPGGRGATTKLTPAVRRSMAAPYAATRPAKTASRSVPSHGFVSRSSLVTNHRRPSVACASQWYAPPPSGK
jgi:hypothetical protein